MLLTSGPRIFSLLLLLVSGSATAATQMSEGLSNWHSAPATAPQSPPVQPPLELRSSSDASQSIIRELVLLKGHTMLGTPYVYGSNETDAVDCSGLIQQLFQSAGIELPRTTRDLANIGEPVSRQSLEPGDLLFYRWRKHALHVAVYAGDGLVIHASPGEHSVVITELNQLWTHHFVAARRVMS